MLCEVVLGLSPAKIGSVAEKLAHVSDRARPMAELAARLASQRPEDRPSSASAALLELEDARNHLWGSATLRECWVCMSEKEERAGVMCSNAHFLCATDCLGRHCKDQADQAVMNLKKRGGMPACGAVVTEAGVEQKCGALLTEADIARLPPGDKGLEAHRAAQQRLAEDRLRPEIETAVRREFEARAALSLHEQRVRDGVEEVVRLMTHCCPSCDAQFIDFDGCFAVTCGLCKRAFCAWCLLACGDDAHRHVARCEDNLSGTVFGSQAQFAEAMRRLKQRRLDEWKRETKDDIRAAVLATPRVRDAVADAREKTE